jgi:hypothetical protein
MHGRLPHFESRPLIGTKAFKVPAAEAERRLTAPPRRTPRRGRAVTRKKTDTTSARISIENPANGGQRGAGALAFEAGDGKVASLLGIAASARLRQRALAVRAALDRLVKDLADRDRRGITHDPLRRHEPPRSQGPSAVG